MSYGQAKIKLNQVQLIGIYPDTQPCNAEYST
jgi:hypothetical protein